MNINDFLAIGIVGVAASLAIEAITRHYATKPLESKAVSVGFCLAVGTGYYFLSQTVWWADVVGVLAAASTVYALFFNRTTGTSVG